MVLLGCVFGSDLLWCCCVGFRVWVVTVSLFVVFGLSLCLVWMGFLGSFLLWWVVCVYDLQFIFKYCVVYCILVVVLLVMRCFNSV